MHPQTSNRPFRASAWCKTRQAYWDPKPKLPPLAEFFEFPLNGPKSVAKRGLRNLIHSNGTDKG
jgi:hypothetical protein